MTHSNDKNSTRTSKAWLELEKICRKIHERLYKTCDMASAVRFRVRLEKMLGELPENDLAILREEGLALLHEMQGEIAQAIKHRKREIQLIERLHKSVEKSIENGDYDSAMGESILEGRSAATLQERRAILATLERQRNSSKRIAVVGIVRPRVGTKRRTG